MKKMIGALALVMAAALPARAQQHDHAQMHGDAQMHREMMMQMHRAHAGAEHGQEIGLSAEQVRRLAAVDSAQMRAMRQHCQQVRAAGGPNAQTHAAMHTQMMAQVQGFIDQANAVLTQPQKARLDSLMAAHHGQMAGHDMAAMHQQHHGAGADSMHAEHHAAAGQHQGEHGDCDGCTDDECCRMMGCKEHEGMEHGQHHHGASGGNG